MKVLKFLLAVVGSLVAGIALGELFYFAFLAIFPQHEVACGEWNMIRRGSSIILVMCFVAMLTFVCIVCATRRGFLSRATGLFSIRPLMIFGGGALLALVATLLWYFADRALFGEFYRTCEEPWPYYQAQIPFLACQIPLYLLFCVTIMWQLVTPRRPKVSPLDGTSRP